ncbi:hypothetical protein FRB99_001122 [Tulasnella sp. 403]|nr:hypothetical protein FRB99_001122 [Tulasnella sp. 403]
MEGIEKLPAAETPSGIETPSLTLQSGGRGSVDKDVAEKPIDEANADEKAVPNDEIDGAQPTAPETHYVTGLPLVLIFVGMMFSIFLVTLDNTILATAIPKIASQFNALEQVTWLASAYFLTQCGLMLMYGQLLARLTTKWVYLTTVVIFEVGSLICGVAPNMNVLIFGRALAGVGAGGLYASTLAIIAVCTPLEKRPILFGAFGAVYAFSSVVGPLMGGAFSDHFGALLLIFLAWEVYMGDDAVLPLALFKSRTQVGCCIESFFLMLIMLCCVFYLPLYYQSAKEHSATRSGIDILLFMVSIIIGAAIGGGTITATGYPRPWLFFSPLLSVIGAGVTFWDLAKRATTSSGILLGMQVLLGFGNTIIMVQAEFAEQPHLIPQSTTLVNFTQLIGGVLGISVSGTIFGNELRKYIAIYAPELDSATADAVRQSVEVIGMLSGAEKVGVVRAYSEALGYVFIIAIPSGILASASALLLPNYNIKKMKLDTSGGTTV